MAAFALAAAAAAAAAVASGFDLHGPSAGRGEEVAEFIRQAGGRIHSGVRVAATPAKGQHVVATAPLRKGEEVFFAPWSALLWADAPSSDPAVVKAHLMHALLSQKRTLEHTGDAKFAAYLRELPGLGHHRNALEYGSLEKSCLDGGGASELQRMLEAWRASRGRLAELEKASPLPHGGAATEDEARWAYANVVSRHTVFDARNRGTLLPFWDFLNHDSVGFNTRSTAEWRKGVSIRAVRDIAAGEELLTSYGSHLSPFKMMANYGFLDTSKEHHRTFLTFEESPPLRKAGCLDPDRVTLLKNGTLSRTARECLTLSVLPPRQRAALAAGGAKARAAQVEALAAKTAEVYHAYLGDVLREGLPPVSQKCRRAAAKQRKEGKTGTLLQMIVDQREYVRSIYVKARRLLADQMDDADD